MKFSTMMAVFAATLAFAVTGCRYDKAGAEIAAAPLEYTASGRGVAEVRIVGSVPAGAEFGIRVSGDSMEPVYQDGQIVWVPPCKTLRCGEVGIFVYGGEGYIKLYGAQEPEGDAREALTDSSGTVHPQPVLISYNRHYEPKAVRPELGFEIVGRVLS